MSVENPSTSGGQAFTQKSQPLQSRLVTCTHGSVGGTGIVDRSVMLISSLIRHCEDRRDETISRDLLDCHCEKGALCPTKQSLLLSSRATYSTVLSVPCLANADGFCHNPQRLVTGHENASRQHHHWHRMWGSQRRSCGFMSKSGRRPKTSHMDDIHGQMLVALGPSSSSTKIS